MVSSGLETLTSVSQYRLAAHLCAAAILFIALIWVARRLEPRPAAREGQGGASPRLWGLLALVLLQIVAGAFVAGLDAGEGYNTWPLMDGAVVPSGLLIQQPFWINFFENPKTVQFVHRLGAYTLFALALVNMVMSLRAAAETTHARRAVLLFALVTLQAAIGIATLLMQVPLHWGLLHQAGALVVFGFAVANWRGFYGEYPRDTVVDVRD
jgi:cytochrome c oxidase assembly protein subunit 15